MLCSSSLTGSNAACDWGGLCLLLLVLGRVKVRLRWQSRKCATGCALHASRLAFLYLSGRLYLSFHTTSVLRSLLVACCAVMRYNVLPQVSSEYYSRLAGLRFRSTAENGAAAPVVYTPLHGVGAPFARKAFQVLACYRALT